MTQSATELNYEPRKHFIRRRHIRITLVGIAVGMAIVIYNYRGAIQLYLLKTEFLWRQHQQLNFTIDPDRVVYEEDPAKGARLLGEGGYSQYRSDFGHTYTLWRPSNPEPPMQARTGSRDTLLFMHERQTEAGQRLLLVVRVLVPENHPEYPGNGDRLIVTMEEFHIADRHNARYWSRDDDRIDLAELDPAQRDAPLRLFGGQVDPIDPTHFTIRYQLGSREGFIDGYEAEGRLGEFGRKEPGRRLEVRKEKTGSQK